MFLKCILVQNVGVLKNKFTDIVVLRRLTDTVGRKRPEKWRTNSLFLLLGQCSSTPVCCGQGFLRTEQCDNTGASPILWWPGYSWYLSVASTEISIEGTALLWLYWHYYEWDGRAEKVFIKGYQECFRYIYNRCQKYTVAQGDYFEGNVA